ncbi:MAG: hypothetical protein HY779_03995 [Rubrobacteridae bacterium]|nr:hypothetical protein [Rubrobacteridae bacterium]
MDKFHFLKKWESHSGVRLINDERERFLDECELLLYLDDDILNMAFKVADQKRNYDLQYIETVGLHLRQYLHRVNYETIDGKGEEEETGFETSTRTKQHLTLIHGGRNVN